MDIQFVRQVCEIMQSAEKEGAELMLHAHRIMAEAKTSSRDVVTEYDRRVQELVIERLTAAVPGACFFGEEQAEHDRTDAEHLFIIDPIDGTMNFVHHLNHSCISIAYASRGQLLAAAVYNPYVDEMFHAVRGDGAFVNDTPLRAGDTPLSGSVVCFGTSPYHPELTDETFRLARLAFDKGLDIRRQGSAELDLCSVAAGRAGLYFEGSVSLWDCAAGMLLVQEAGGDCLTLTGEPIPMDGRTTSIIAGTKTAVREFLAAACRL